MKTKFKIIFAAVAVLVSVTMLAAFIIIEQQTEKKQITEPEVSKTEELNEKITSIEETVSTEETVKAEESSTVKPEEVISSTPAEQTQSQPVLTKKEPEKVKTVTIQGEKITADFVEETQIGKQNLHSRYVYENSNSTVFWLDSVTDRLIYFHKTRTTLKSDGKKIDENEAVTIAEEFIKANGFDLSRYTPIGCMYYDNSKTYEMFYVWVYNGYGSADYIRVIVCENGEICTFSCNPYVFENIKMLPIDEEFLTKQLNEAVEKFKSEHKYNYKGDYAIQTKGISVDKNNELIIAYKIKLNYETIANTSNSTIDIKDNTESVIEEKNVIEHSMILEINVKLDKTGKAPFYEISGITMYN